MISTVSRASTAVNQRKTSRSSPGVSSYGGIQDLVKEKDQHIEQLLKEREMERSEVTRAAAQADEAEHQLALLQRRFQEEQENAAMKISELESLLGPLETARLNQTAQIDDLQFRLEEEMILRTDTESQCKLLEEKE